MTNGLPNGWSEIDLADHVYIAGRIGWRGLKAEEYTSEGPLLLSVPNLNHGDIVDFSDVNHVSNERYNESPEIQIEVGDTLLVKDGAGIGKLGYVAHLPGKATVNSSLLVIRPSDNLLSAKYLFYYLKGPRLQQIALQRITGSATPHLFQKDIKQFRILVPPPAEQKRIVEKLDKVSARVDACQQRLASLPSLVKRFRQSVLAAACSGRLTAKWREQHNTLEEWQHLRIDAICEIIGGSQPPKKYFIYESREGYVRFIQIRDYKSDDHLTFIPKELARRFCSKTDVMVGRYGPPLFQILRGIEGAYNVALMKAVPKSPSQLVNDYLFILLQDPSLKNYIISASERTVGQDGVRKDLLEQYEIDLPPVIEQKEIVRRVEALFALADRIGSRHAKASAQVAKLTQSTLAKAFLGELVPTEAELAESEGRDYESAEELLERIREVRAPVPLAKRNGFARGKARRTAAASS